jgi:anti-sigma regulatory factor (Ser/Thr protein kinase)
VTSKTVTTFLATYPSAFDSVAVARRAVGVFAQSCGFSPSETSDIVLAVGEACSNAVEHGHTTKSHIVVRCTFEGDKLTIEVGDHGHGFDEKRTRNAPIPAEFLGRGRGIPIMRAVMDDVRYEITNAGTTVFLERRLVPRDRTEALREKTWPDAGS